MPILHDKNNFTKMYAYLQLGGKHTAKELSKKLNLSTRTVQSYLKKLREEYGLQKEKTRYFFADNHRYMDMDERVQMSSALMISLYKQTIPIIEEKVLKNFRKIPKETNAFLFNLDFQEIKNETFFNQITNSIINKISINFKYKNTKNKISIKNVFPLRITNILGYWYLMGYDLESDKVKTYYFNNIRNLTNLEESYIDTQKMQKLTILSSCMNSPWYNENQKSVLLKISKDAIIYIQRQKSDMFEILKTKPSYLLIKMKYYDDIEVLSFVKKWIPFIEIVDNKALKRKLHDMLKNYISK